MEAPGSLKRDRGQDGGAVYIWFKPLEELLWSMTLDFFDSRVFLRTLTFEKRAYHRWDKMVDFAAYVTELMVAARYGVFLPLLGLFLWRMMGTVLYMHSGKAGVFIGFPNFLEMAFLWLILFFPEGSSLSAIQSYQWWWLFAFLVGKLCHEVADHWYWPKVGWKYWHGFVGKAFSGRRNLRLFFSSIYAW